MKLILIASLVFTAPAFAKETFESLYGSKIVKACATAAPPFRESIKNFGMEIYPTLNKKVKHLEESESRQMVLDLCTYSSNTGTLLLSASAASCSAGFARKAWKNQLRVIHAARNATSVEEAFDKMALEFIKIFPDSTIDSKRRICELASKTCSLFSDSFATYCEEHGLLSPSSDKKAEEISKKSTEPSTTPEAAPKKERVEHNEHLR